MALPIRGVIPWPEVTCRIGEQQADLALEDLVNMAGGGLQQAVSVTRAGEFAAHGVERRSAPFMLAGGFRLLP